MAIYRSKNTGVATGGNGSDFAANACGTINECSTAAVETRCLASTDTVMAGVTVGYVKGTATVPNRYLPFNAGNLSSFAALITDCLSTSGWVANPAGDVALSYLVATHTKYGTGNKMKLTFDAVPQVNTLQAYCPVANLSLAAFQNVCAWMQDYVGTCPANSLVIKLCTGNDGVTGVVATMTWTEAMAALSVNTPVCLNNGAALANGINSIAIYTGAVAPAAASVWAFDRFYATVAGFDLDSILHKPWKTAWTANEVVGAAAIRVPTFAYHAPLRFQTTAGGTCGATEPDWDTAMLPALGSFAGQTITDGTVIWTCMGDDEAYYFWTIKSLDIANNRIEIDNHTANVGAAGRGYYGTDETAGLSYLTPFLYPMAATSATVMDSIGASGTDAAPKLISGGWTSPGGVDTVTGVTVLSARNGLGYFLQNSTKSAIKITGGIAFVRCQRAYDLSINTVPWTSIRQVFFAGCIQGISVLNSYPLVMIFQYLWAFNGGANSSFSWNTGVLRAPYSVKSFGNMGATALLPQIFINGSSIGLLRGCGAFNGVGYAISAAKGIVLINFQAALNTIATIVSTGGIECNAKNLLTTDTVPCQSNATTYGAGGSIKVQNFGGVTGDNRVYYPSMGQATYNSTTHVWTIAVNNVNATLLIPMRHEVGFVRCDTAGVQYTVSLDVNPSNAALIAQLKILGNTIAGVGYDLFTASAGAGLQTLTLTFTPLEVGIVKIYLDCYITNTTLTYTLVYDLDSLAATKNAVAMVIFGIGEELFGEEMVRADLGTDLLAWETARNTITPSHVENLFLYKALGANEIGALGSTSSQSSRSDSSYSHSSESFSHSSQSHSSQSDSSKSDSISTSSDSSSNSVSSASSGSSSSLSLDGDCIQAQITAKLKSLLANVTIANGYHYDVKAVEQARKVLDINGRWPFILLCENEPEIEEDLIVRSIEYIAWFFSEQDDELIGDPVADHDSEIAFKNRNAISDIAKAIHQDIYLGGLAENCEVEPGNHDLYIDGNTTLFGTWCFIRVTTSIDSTDPYKLR